jgi:cytochrome P450/NADPH-cytochrome P450 reductase
MKGDLYQYVLGVAAGNSPIARYNDANVFVLTADLAAEVCDETRFEQSRIAALGRTEQHPQSNQTATLRGFLGDGLQSAYSDEPAWGRGHRILADAFSPSSVNRHVDAITDCCEELTSRLVSIDNGKDVQIPAMAAGLFFEVMSRYAFSRNMGSFYSDGPTEMIQTAKRVVHELVLRRLLPPTIMKFDVRGNREINRDIATMHAFADGIVAARRALGPGNEGDDLLGHMLTTPDPQTGEYLSDINIRYQLLTLLGAGQEGPHNMLSVALHVLAADRPLMTRLRSELDAVLGTAANRAPTVEDLSRLTLLAGVVNETLRLYPSAVGFARSARETTVVGGQYELTPDTSVVVFMAQVHRDPAVWPDPNTFDADRWTPQMQASLPSGAFKPFGTGPRACIGRLLAITEVQLALATLVHRFDISPPSGELEFGLTLTLQPKPFTLRFTPRPDLRQGPRSAPAAVSTPTRSTTPTPSTSTATDVATAERSTAPVAADASPTDATDSPSNAVVSVWHASDGGTALALARRVAAAGRDHGFDARVAPLSEAVDALAADHPNVIIAASYNGQPATTGAAFMTWLASQPAGSLAGRDFAVFGCGDHNWPDTYQAVPTALDTELAAAGGNRLLDRGLGDTSADFEAAFSQWLTGLWALLAPDGGERTDAGATLVGGADPDQLAHDLDLVSAVVLSSAELQRHWGADSSEHSTVHVELELPAGSTYQPGDHILVLPHNRAGDVRAAAALFGIQQGTLIRVHNPANHGGEGPELVDAYSLLQRHYQLSGPAGRDGIGLLAQYVDGEGHREHLLSLADDPGAYQSEVLDARVSLLDLAVLYPPSETLPIAHLDRAFPALKPRTYSVSSAPTGDGQRASLTVGVLQGPALSGRGSFHGTCSGYLASLREDDDLHLRVKRPGPGFSLPDDAETAVIMICAGTGIAPFRSFLQHLATRHSAGEPVPPVVLIRGCRRSDHDHIYGDEVAAWVDEGWLRYYPAYSHEPGQPGRHVEDVIVAEAGVLNPLLDSGAKVLVCGDSDTFYADIENTMLQIRQAAGGDADGARQWLDQQKSSGGYVIDIWA